MNILDAEKILDSFYSKSNYSEEDEYEFIEALEYLIDQTNDPNYMMQLGGHYYEIRRFDLALKYYEMAADFEILDAYECLGYIWYYGRTGERDYEKAFKYFQKAADGGDAIAAYKLADMYKNGYFVEKDYEKYKEIIERLYITYRAETSITIFAPVPEIYTRLARIRKEEGRIDEAVDLYLDAKNFLAQRIRFNPFFGNLNIMKWLVQDLYTITEFDEDFADIFDLYYLLSTPAVVEFRYGDETYKVESLQEDDEIVIRFEDKWYRTIDDFFAKAEIDNELLTAIYTELYIISVDR